MDLTHLLDQEGHLTPKAINLLVEEAKEAAAQGRRGVGSFKLDNLVAAHLGDCMHCRLQVGRALVDVGLGPSLEPGR